MYLLSTIRLVPTRMRLLFCIALGALLFLGLWRARLYRLPGINGQSSTDTDSGNDPRALMARADHFYWLNNGYRAAPLYARAEQLFSKEGDPRSEIHAKIGRLRSGGETMSFVELSRMLEQELQNPIVEHDKALRLRCLVAKGYTDIEVDYYNCPILGGNVIICIDDDTGEVLTKGYHKR